MRTDQFVDFGGFLTGCFKQEFDSFGKFCSETVDAACCWGLWIGGVE